MLKKLGIGSILACVAAICSLFGFIFYLVNAGTSYFAGMGVNGLIVASFILTIVFEIAYVAGPLFKIPFVDVVGAVGAGVFSAIGLITLVGARISGIASILTFEANASTTGMMISAIVAIVFALIAFIVALVAAFLNPVKEENK